MAASKASLLLRAFEIIRMDKLEGMIVAAPSANDRQRWVDALQAIAKDRAASAVAAVTKEDIEERVKAIRRARIEKYGERAPPPLAA